MFKAKHKNEVRFIKVPPLWDVFGSVHTLPASKVVMSQYSSDHVFQWETPSLEPLKPFDVRKWGTSFDIETRGVLPGYVRFFDVVGDSIVYKAIGGDWSTKVSDVKKEEEEFRKRQPGELPPYKGRPQRQWIIPYQDYFYGCFIYLQDKDREEDILHHWELYLRSIYNGILYFQNKMSARAYLADVEYLRNVKAGKVPTKDFEQWVEQYAWKRIASRPIPVLASVAPMSHTRISNNAAFRIANLRRRVRERDPSIPLRKFDKPNAGRGFTKPIFHHFD